MVESKKSNMRKGKVEKKMGNKRDNMKRKNVVKNGKNVKNVNMKEIGIFGMPEKLCVIGDIHADYEAFVFTLKKAGMINNKMEWAGRKTYLVLIGDLVDGKTRMGSWKGDSDMKVVNLVEKLMVMANKKGGKVIVLLGNHEFMNMRGNFSYSGDGGIKEMGGESGRKKYFGTKFKKFGKGCYVAVKIGDWIFCHAGIPPEISLLYTIPELNRLSIRYFSNLLKPNEEKQFFEIISGDNGILTTREFGLDPVNCNRLNISLTQLKGKYMVVGHTVQTMINSVCNTKLWRVDVGISRAFGDNFKRRVGFLVIYEYGKKIKVY